jgi:NAD(P)-dependent dehydrogenase (short-subunit alcohol dehydrogenase family)
MKGKVCIVTGSNSGLGKETALALAQMGAAVVMVVRNKERGERAREEIVKKSGNSSVDVMVCDLSSLDSIRKFSEDFKEKYNRLDVLVNNAGAFFSKRQTTADGFEKTLMVDYLGQVLLTHELLTLLKSSAPSRIVNVSSSLHRVGSVDFEDLQNEKNYNKSRPYADAKLMLVMFTYELARRLEGIGVTVNALHPGFVATNIGENAGGLLSKITFKLMRPLQLSAKKGAETQIYLSSSDEVKGVTGKYFVKKKEVKSAPISYIQNVQKQLWDKTMDMLKLSHAW